MSGLLQLETVILLLIAVLALTTIARKLVIPYPILLVIGGLALVFLPSSPRNPGRLQPLNQLGVSSGSSPWYKDFQV